MNDTDVNDEQREPCKLNAVPQVFLIRQLCSERSDLMHPGPPLAGAQSAEPRACTRGQNSYVKFDCSPPQWSQILSNSGVASLSTLSNNFPGSKLRVHMSLLVQVIVSFEYPEFHTSKYLGLVLSHPKLPRYEWNQ